MLLNIHPTWGQEIDNAKVKSLEPYIGIWYICGCSEDSLAKLISDMVVTGPSSRYHCKDKISAGMPRHQLFIQRY